MASCTRPSTASSESGLSDPPTSPSHLAASTITVKSKNGEGRIGPQLDAGAKEDDVNGEVGEEEPEEEPEEISAYVRNEFDFYDENDVPEESDSTPKIPKDPELAEKSRYPFKKLTPVEVFEEYLRISKDTPYDELYHRTARVSGILAKYQDEWDSIEKEVNQHEGVLKGTKERADDAAKELERKRTEESDERLAKVAELYKAQLKCRGDNWDKFLVGFKSKFPRDTETLAILQNLKDPLFMAGVKKRQKKEEGSKYENAPWPEKGLTKDEEKLERKRRLGRLADPIAFDDRKQADVYGQDYSAKENHVGRQPLTIPGNPDEANGRSTRQPRQSTRKRYDEEESVTPETEPELPAKRPRKPRTFGEDIDSGTRSRGASQSRDATPAVKRFQSGKRVGRPPNPSKLQNVQSAPASDMPELGVKEEAELQQAAESLVNQTVTDQAAAEAPPMKKKHPGGRPKKIVPEATVAESSTTAGPSGPSVSRPGVGESSVPAPIVKPKHPGGRPRKNVAKAPTEEKSTAQTITAKSSAAAAPEKNPTPDASASEPVKRKHPGGRPKKHVPETSAANNSITAESSQAPASEAASSVPAPRKKHAGGRPKKVVAQSSTVAAPSEMSAPEAAILPKPKNKGGRPRKHPIKYEKETDTSRQKHLAEMDNQSRATSSVTSRPTTSSSSETASSFGNHMATRRSTRAKSRTQETNANSVTVLDHASSSGGKGKRKLNTNDTDSSTLVVDSAPIDSPSPPVKRRKTRGVRQQRVAETPEPSPEPESSMTATSRPKRKRTATESTIAVADPSEAVEEPSPAIKKRKTTHPASITPATLPRTVRKTKLTPVPTRPASTRVRIPTRIAMGLDGVDEYDDDDALEDQFATEYESYQALTSPKGNMQLGKRKRRSLMDLSAVMQSDDDEDEEYFA